jgi:hypothetical protein
MFSRAHANIIFHTDTKRFSSLVATLTGFSDGDLHGEVEEVGVAMAHAVLVEQGGHHLATGRLERDAQGFVFYVRAQTAGVHLYGCLQAETSAAVAKSVRTVFLSLANLVSPLRKTPYTCCAFGP